MSANCSHDRASLCAFKFADGRKCRMPRRAGHPYLCAFHARKEAQTLAGDKAGSDIAYYLSGDFLSACDLSSALGRLFAAVAQGHVKPKTASTLAYLGQTLVQALPLAQNEYIQAYDTDSARHRPHRLRTMRRLQGARSPIASSNTQARRSPRARDRIRRTTSQSE